MLHKLGTFKDVRITSIASSYYACLSMRMIAMFASPIFLASHFRNSVSLLQCRVFTYIKSFAVLCKSDIVVMLLYCTVV